MREALAITGKLFHKIAPSEVYCEDLRPDEIQQLEGEEIRHCCAPFIAFIPSEEGAKDGLLRTSHSSVFRFLREHSASTFFEVEEVRIDPNIISNACLKYLSQRRYAATSDKSPVKASGSSNKTEFLQDHYFFAYAAKYWHKHLDEASPISSQVTTAFLCSSQFITLQRYQSLLLDRHFNLNLKGDSKKSQFVSAKIPANSKTKADLQILADNYRFFIKEWANFLQLGITTSPLRGEIERCFWGALGKKNFLWNYGSMIECNRSYLLDIADFSNGNKDQQMNKYCFYETLSDDGSRMAVWQVPVRRYRP